MTSTLVTKEITIEQAKQRTADHKRDFSMLERGWVRLGRDVEESVRLGVPSKLGMTMRAWLADTFEASASHIFRQLQSYRALQGLPETTLLAIPEANAHELTRLAENDRKDPATVAKAISQRPKDFKKTVDLIRHQKYGITPSKWETFVVRVPVEVYDALIAAQDKMATVLELDLTDDEHRAARLVTVWEAVAQLINSTDEARLKLETEGN